MDSSGVCCCENLTNTWQTWHCLRWVIPPGRVKTGRQGSCFGSEEYLRARSRMNAYTGINEKPRAFTSSYHRTWENLTSLSVTGLQVVISQNPQWCKYSIQSSTPSCRTLRQGPWKRSIKDWFLKKMNGTGIICCYVFWRKRSPMALVSWEGSTKYCKYWRTVLRGKAKGE